MNNQVADYKIKKVSWWYFFVKRCFDIFNSLLALIVLSPLLLLFTILVACTSRGPVFFKDVRVGKLGKPIKV
jgi:lipopolysaccharide/colanic/teichoic acid biosynthesis glycosyltransferase